MEDAFRDPKKTPSPNAIHAKRGPEQHTPEFSKVAVCTIIVRTTPIDEERPLLAQAV
jgi:hypothetical protein